MPRNRARGAVKLDPLQRVNTERMQLEDAKDRFIQAWGALGSQWGINRTMAQVHALLLVSPDSLSTEDIMGMLKISRGNANMNLRALIDWGLVNKEHKTGERRDYFYAEKEIWYIARQVIIERRKRELKPVLKVLAEVKEVEGQRSNQDVKAFLEAVEDLENIVFQADKFLERLVHTEMGWVLDLMSKLPRKKVEERN